MIDQEDKEEMQEDGEVSLGCSQNKEFNKNPEKNGDAVKTLSEFKEIHSGVPVEHHINLLNKETFSDEGFYGSMYQSDFYMWPPFHHDFHKVQQCHLNPFDNGYYSMNPECGFPFDSRYQCISFNMLPQAYHPHEFPSQEFQYFVVIDFEATCDKEKIPNPQEIIEFPSVLVNSLTGQLEASFQTYVRPIYHQLLSDFCKDLTGIQQIQVDRGVSLSEALMMHDKWLEDKGIKHTSFAVVTWSNWDCQVMLESECRFKKIRKPTYFNRWINLKIPFGEVFGGVRCNLKEAIRVAGLTWEGRAHCGLDDARNTARLLANLMHRGFKFSITDSLMCPSPDNKSNPPQLPKKAIGSYHHYPSPKHPTSMTQYPMHPYCFCGAKSYKLMASKPGQNSESCFYSCGYWTATRGPLCNYFKWAYP